MRPGIEAGLLRELPEFRFERSERLELGRAGGGAVVGAAARAAGAESRLLDWCFGVPSLAPAAA